MERLERIAYNRANERQNTVQPQAVNLAYAEPCPDQRSRHGSFYLPAVLARNARRWQEKAGYPQISHLRISFAFWVSQETRARPWTPVPSDAMCAVARRLGGFVYEALFETTQGDRGRSKCLHDFTQERHRTRERVPEGRGPAEGAHVVRRCAGVSKSAHLGKPRRFLRRCAPFSKMRTENCATSKGDGLGHRFRPVRTPCLALRTFPDAYGALTNSFKWSEDLVVNRTLVFFAARQKSPTWASLKRDSPARENRMLHADLQGTAT
jgi:hypothetical protein